MFVLDWESCSFEEDRWGLVPLLVGCCVTHTSKMDFILAVIDQVTLTIHSKPSIQTANDEGGCHEDRDDDEHHKDDSRRENSKPLPQCSSGLWAPSSR